jgi:hypothetical protein
MGRGTFNVESLGLSGCCEVKASARIRASSLSDKPIGTDGTSNVESLGLSGCCEVRASARICASSLSDKPTGADVTGRENGERIGSKEDRWRRAIVSALSSSVTTGNSRCSVVIPEFRVASVDLGPLHLGSRPRLRRTMVTIPITAKMAPAPPMVPPTIAPIFRFLSGVGASVVPLAFIGSTGALRESQSGMKR